MNNKNLKTALIAAAIYLAVTIGETALMAWIGLDISTDGTVGFINAAYIALLATGLVITFAYAYAFHDLLSRSTHRYAQANPDVPENLVKPICQGRLLSRCYGLTSAVCLVSAAVTFALSGEAYIEILCLLVGIGFTTLLLGLQYRDNSRQLYRLRFRLSILGRQPKCEIPS